MKSFTLGIIGGGQLGKMLALECKKMNISTLVWTGGLEAPAASICDAVIDLPFHSKDALKTFTQQATVATVEFENIPIPSLEEVAASIPLHPSPHAIQICQNREQEKSFLRQQNIPHAPFFIIDSSEALASAMQSLKQPCVLKTAAFGYDGKGQIKLKGNEDATRIWQEFSTERAVLEAWIPFEKEISIMIARNSQGEIACYSPAENQHRHHILDLSIVPARVHESVAKEAQDIAERIVKRLDYVGIMGVEFFMLPNGELLVNEMAPRPHNSGHYTMDASATSQFEQQIRSVCGFPLGSTRLLSPVVMLNLLGDMWLDPQSPPDWSALLAKSGSSLHLYGKKEAQGRRKMGHANFTNTNLDAALSDALELKSNWLSAHS